MMRETEERNPIELLCEEFLDRRRRGERLSVSEFAELNPHHSDRIRRLFPAMLALETCKSSRLSVSATSSKVELNIGSVQQLGDFRIVEEIGRGGMGVVFEAEQQSLQRRVAVKVFPRQALPDSKHLDRFHREAKTAARLHHTNIVPVFGVGHQDSLHYYVMQRIDGISLDEVIVRCARSLHKVSQPERASNRGTHDGEVLVDDGDTDRVCTRRETEPLVKQSEQGDSARRSPVVPRSSFVGLLAESNSESGRFGPLRELSDELPGSCDSWQALFETQGPPLWRAIANVGIQVAEALEYAHAQGVLHRDIKPSNLLLDHYGTVWVTDFGLATAVESEQRAHPEEVAGTLRFMSPEHISGVQDARSDIYSLGLTLYELLTLRPAFDDSSRTIMLSKIMKGEVAAPRQTCAEIPKDLEAIVMRAMARDSEERYRCAADLATDLRRFLQGRPVSARPLSPPLQFFRWTQRNPVVASLGAALLLTGVTSFFVVGAKWKDAVAENQRAEANLTLALESLDQILERFTSSWMAHPSGAAADANGLDPGQLEMQMAVSDHSAEVLQDALKFYDRFAQQNPTNPQLDRDTATVHRRVADIYQRLGQHAKAEEAYRRSLRFLDAEPIADDDSLDLQRAEIRNQLGFSLYSASRFGDAEREFREALNLVSRSPQGSEAEGRAQEARIRTNLAQCLALMLQGEQAADSQRMAVGILETLVQQYPGNTTYQLELARAYRSQYWLMGFRRKDDRGEAEVDPRQVIRDEAVQILEGLVRDYPNVPDFRCELSDLLIVTSPPSHRGKADTSELERAVSLARELSDSHPTIPRYRTILALGLMKLADRQCEKHIDEAEGLFDESINLLRSLTRSFPDTPVYRVFLVHALRDQASAFRRLDRLDEARHLMEAAIVEQTHNVHLRPDNYMGRRFLARLKEDLQEMQ